MSRFIRPQHPKVNLAPTGEAFARVLAAGWAGQLKANGHRLQAHISAAGEVVAYTRQGTKHTALLPSSLKEALIASYRPEKDWTVVDAEWQKQEGKLYLFDLLKSEGVLLDKLTYRERQWKLQQFSLLPCLPLCYTVEECLAVMADPSPFIEGLVFRCLKVQGFGDNAIVRCRKSGAEFKPQRTRGVKA